MRQISAEVIELLQNRTVVLDTNVFVEGYSHPQEFSGLLEGLAVLGCTLTTIQPIRLEFLSKNRSVEELTKKITFYKLKKYAANALLLTNNHHDFTPELFTLITVLPLTPKKGSIIPFGLYAFSEDSYGQLLAADTRQARPSRR